MYLVNNIYPSVQGEGVMSGQPMIILRLHGCAVGCSFCDTQNTWRIDDKHEVETIEECLGDTPYFTRQSASQINYYLRRHYPNIEWIMLTGGEPADQDLVGLVNALHDGGYKILLETSGTAEGHMNADIDWVCVSPKINMPGGKTVLPHVVAAADEIKHVVGIQKHIDQLDDLLSSIGEFEGIVSLQPMSVSVNATKLCYETVLARGWRLSIQTHKYIGIE